MKMMKRTERVLLGVLVLGVFVAIAGPIWSRVQVHRANLLGTQALRLEQSNAPGPEGRVEQSEENREMMQDVVRLARVSRHGITAGYIGLLVCVLSLSGLWLLLKGDVTRLMKREDAQPEN